MLEEQEDRDKIMTHQRLGRDYIYAMRASYFRYHLKTSHVRCSKQRESLKSAIEVEFTPHNPYDPERTPSKTSLRKGKRGTRAMITDYVHVHYIDDHSADDKTMPKIMFEMPIRQMLTISLWGRFGKDSSDLDGWMGKIEEYSLIEDLSIEYIHSLRCLEAEEESLFRDILLARELNAAKYGVEQLPINCANSIRTSTDPFPPPRII